MFNGKGPSKDPNFDNKDNQKGGRKEFDPTHNNQGVQKEKTPFHPYEEEVPEEKRKITPGSTPKKEKDLTGK